MSDYVKTTNFYVKDSLLIGNPDKIVKGSELDTEFNNIATAIASKANYASPNLTGIPTTPTAASGTNTTQIASTAFVKSAIDASNASANITGGTIANTAISNSNITGGTITALSTDLAVADGGTGVSSLLDNAVIIGAGTSPVEFVSPGSAGNVLKSDGTNWISGTISAGIGDGQSWQNPSRSHGTTYQNTTGKPIMVMYGGIAAGKNVATTLEVSTDGSNWVTAAYTFSSNDDDINGGSLTIIVPNGHYYRSNGTIWNGGGVWAELR